jgi:Rrf2 family protein
MLELAASHGGPNPVRIKSIVDSQKIPQRFLVQILLQLKTAGLVSSVRGAAGGYQLARPPEKISLMEIIRAIDDRSLSPRSALAAANHTSVVEVLLGVWHEIQLAEQRMLERQTLAELLRRTQQRNALSYQI